jgi:thiamine biosynthesis lipoprotein
MQIPTGRWAVALIVALAAGCAKPPTSSAAQRFQYVQLLMGVENRVVVYAPDEAMARNASKAAFDRVAELEDIMSDYRPDSELMRLCARAGTGPVPVSSELFEVLAFAQKVSEASDGAFDVTVGPYVKLWRQARKTKTLPSESALAQARRRVGWRLIKLNPQHQTVELTEPGMQLDLGGIAKGYAGDEAIRVLGEHGIASALYEAGGDIVVSDPPPDKSGWAIESRKNVTLRNAAVSTSGDTVQFVEIAGVRYSHVVDSRTGRGLTDHLMATVIAPRGLVSDPLSKVATVLPPRKSEPILRRFGARGDIHRAGSTTSETNP